MRARMLQFFRSAISLLPTLAVLGVLGVLAIVGHLTKWKITEVTALWKASTSADQPVTRSNGDKQRTETSGLRFESMEVMQKSGIKTVTVTKRLMSRSVVANGIIDYDRTRMAQLSTRAPGTVWKVYKRVGEPVRKGEILGLVDAVEVGRAKGEFLQALRMLQLKTDNLERQKRAHESGAVPERMLRESEAAVAEARIRLFSAQQALANLGLPIRLEQVNGLPDERLTGYLRFLGLPESITQSLDPLSTTANLLPLVAPFDGVVIRSDVVEGELISSASPQYTVADLRRLWVLLDVRQEDMAGVRQGQRIAFHADGAAETDATIRPARSGSAPRSKTTTASYVPAASARAGFWLRRNPKPSPSQQPRCNGRAPTLWFSSSKRMASPLSFAGCVPASRTASTPRSATASGREKSWRPAAATC
jgi:multidrug efflux pump subunit AcrA (membrane-fusion protein)